MSVVYEKIKENILVVYSFAIVLVVATGFLCIGDDMQILLRWDLVLFACNIAVLPLLGILFRGFTNTGYLFGRVIGLCLSSYVLWFFSSLEVIEFGKAGTLLSVLIIAILNYGIYMISKKKKIDNKLNLELIIICEFYFLLILLLSTWLLGHKIPATETERLMDYAFMASIDKTKYMPPLDMWAANEYINYYYYGQYMMTYLCKMAFVSVERGYSLSISTILTIGVSYVFLLVYMIASRINKGFKYLGHFAGIISAAAVMLAGNVHYIVYNGIIPLIRNLFGMEEGEKYWFANSTRYIGYAPLNEADRTITEFPIYSILIGDLHAHVINIMVVLSIIGIIIAYAYNTIEGPEEDLSCEVNISGINKIIYDTLCKIFNPNLILCAFLIGISSMSNYWDFAIYYVFCGAVILMVNFLKEKKLICIVMLTLLEGLVFGLIINCVNLLFRKNFVPMFDGIGRVEFRTPLYQMAILWGLPIACVILFAVFVITEHKFYIQSEGVTFEKNSVIYVKNKMFEFSDILVILISLCAVGLIIVPEFIYVKDIYINGFPRANTMFKMTYEAFILFGISIGYILVRIIFSKISDDLNIRQFCFARTLKRWGIFFFIIWLFTLGYLFTSLRMWFGELKTWDYMGTDSTSTIIRDMGDEYDSVLWINENVFEQETILVADGNSYTDYDIIPALTGNPTVLGWMTHEWLWHNSYDYVVERQNDIRELYCGNNIDEKKRLLDKYNISYIYIGSKEYEKYPDINIRQIFELGSVVYTDARTNIYIVKTE